MTDNIVYKVGITFNIDNIRELYEDAKWITYTKDIENLMKSIENSLIVITAWDNDKLVGLVRVVGDGISIIYIQDILVLNSYKRRGIGSKLIEEIFKEYTNIRQIVLLTDDREETRGFYESLGFKSSDKLDLVSFVKFN